MTGALNNMFLNERVASGSQYFKLASYHTKTSNHAIPFHPCGSALNFRDLSCQRREDFPLEGGASFQLLVAPALFTSGKYGNLRYGNVAMDAKVQSRKFVPSAALKPLSIYPKMTTKPKWLWRALACFPYLMPLHKLWLYADSSYRLHFLLEDWEFLVNPFIDTMMLSSGWSLMFLYSAVYFFVVRRKEWPHFLRFHVIMAMLIDNAMEIMAITCRWWPKTVYRGRLGTHFWIAIALAQLYTIVECMRCSLMGKYADVPFVSDAAYIQSDPEMR